MRSTFNILFYVKFEDDNLAFVRDIFAFVCFTALSFIDVKNLTTDNIVDVNGDKWIISKRHKTNIPFQVKLMDVPLQIIDRYKHLCVALRHKVRIRLRPSMALQARICAECCHVKRINQSNM